MFGLCFIRDDVSYPKKLRVSYPNLIHNRMIDCCSITSPANNNGAMDTILFVV
jgi:hypothetical protein